MTSDFILIFALGALAGVLVGCIVTYQVALRVSYRMTDVQPEITRDTSEANLRLQLDAESKWRRQDRVNDAYGKLMGWLYELEITVDGVWIGTHSENPETREQIKKTIDEWPWKTLKPPRYVAATQHYWSEEARALLGKLYEQSHQFTMAAFSTLIEVADRQADSKETDSITEKYQIFEKLLQEHIEMRKIFARTREQVRHDLAIDE